VFANEIRALSVTDSAIPVTGIDIALRVADNNVNVRKSPSASSPVVTQIARNTEVKTVEATVEEFTINGQTAPWFHIVQPVDGWIFGAWLSENGATDDM
jgi:uncharacterized protein YgiM (DUF1202 family)